MIRRIILATARIMLGIPTLKVTYNNLRFRTCCPTLACHILKTGIVVNKIYTRKLSTATGMHSSSWCDIEKNCLISKPWSRKARIIIIWAT